MSQTIDHRIVEMRFDNKQFEAGAKQTIGTLDKLKESLKLPETGKALEGLDKATKNISLDGIAAGVEALERRFSTFGIVGMRAIENITDGLMSKLQTAVNFVTDSIVSGGIKRAMNIENAHFQLQALLKDETKVQAVMADAMESVDGTAYAYDEAAKAASQFAASGIQAGDEMLGALKGITGVAAMTNSSFEDISRVFTTVAGNGRLMGDQLLQLSSRGLNAASTLADYFKEVRGQSSMTESTIREMVSKGKISFKDFSDAMTWAFGDSAKRANETFTGAMSNMKSALARIGAGFISPLVEQNGELVQLFNALRIKINDVKTALVFDEQSSAISGLAKVTGLTSDNLKEMFKAIKSNGSVTISDLEKISEKGVNATEAIKNYINGVSDGSIRASYSITNSIHDLTNGIRIGEKAVERYVENGKVDINMFTSAMENAYGDQKLLSKQFTDFFLNNIKLLVTSINEADMTKPMAAFYYWVESVKNIAKGLLSVVKPVGKAFAEVFLNFDADDVITFSEAIKNLTDKMKLSESGSKNLHDAMKGLFSVVKLGADIFFKLVGAIVPINEPVLEMGDGFLDLAGSMGRALTYFTETIRSCELLKKAFNLLSSGFSMGMKALSSLVKTLKSFVSAIADLEGTTKLIDSISKAFEKLSIRATPYIESFINEVESFLKSLFDLEDINIDEGLKAISDLFLDLAWEIDNFSIKTIEDGFDTLRKKIESFNGLTIKNEGLLTFITNLKQFGEDLREAFTLDNLLDRVEKVMDVFGQFFKWVKETMAPAFEDFNIGSAIAATGGFGIIYSMIKVAKSLDRVSKAVTKIPDILGAVKGTLVAYQKELKADALIKTAGAIAILAGALVLLSFADSDRIIDASVALSLIAGVLLLGVSKLLDAANKGKELNSAMTVFSKGLSKTMQQFGKAVKIKAISSALKDFGITIALISGSIIALGLMWKKDSNAFNAALETIGEMVLILIAVGGLMAIGSNFINPKLMTSMSLTMVAFSSSLLIIVKSLYALMKIPLGDKYGVKLAILGGIFVAFGVLMMVMAKSAAISKGKQLPDMAKTIGSLAILLAATVLSLKVLFAMDLGDKYGVKLAILGGIFVAFGVLIMVMAEAAKVAKGKGFNAGVTILAMAVFLGAVVAALFVLTLIPVDKMIKGAVALGGILVTLGVALAGAGKISDKNAGKTVLAMALTVGVITASLAILSMIPFNKLLKSAVALGGVLLALALDFEALSKVKSKNALPSVLAMIAATVVIAVSLNTLSKQPWESLLAASAAMSLTLLAFAKAFEMILSKTWSKNNVKKIGTFLLLTLAVIPIGGALAILSKQPWDSLLAAGASMALTLLAFTACFAIISKVKVDPMAIAAVVAGSASLLLVAVGISMLAKYDGQNLLNSCLALSAMLIVMMGVMAICAGLSSVIGPAMVGVLGLAAVIAELGIMLAAFGGLAQIPGLKWIIGEGGDLLELIGVSIGKFLGGILGGIIIGISSQLPKLGSDLSAFMLNLTPFIVGIKMIDEDALKNVGFLSAIILALTATSVINGIASLFGISLVAMGVELSAFMVALTPFIAGSKMIDEESVKACGYIADMILKLTAAQFISGISEFFGLSGKLSDFAEELKAFAPAIVEFAETVKDVNPEAVEGAASAASIMAEVAGKLQGHGGIIQEIMGEKSLALFAEELKAFGPSIAEFAETVKDVNPEAVEGAASAASIMAEVSDNLPPLGGLADLIFGSKSLAEFAEELKAFGPAIVDFADVVKDVNPESIKGAKTITEILTELKDNLPSSESLWQKIFGGGKSFTDFGEELIEYADQMIAFSNKLSSISSTKISSFITYVKDLLDIAKQASETSTEGVKATINSLSGISFNFSDELSDGISKSKNEIIKGSSEIMTSFANGIKSKSNEIKLAVSNVIKVMIDSIKAKNQEFKQAGENAFKMFGDGFKSKEGEVKSTLSSILSSVKKSLEDNKSFETAGANAAKGFINGLAAKNFDAYKAGQKLGEAALNGAKSKKSLDEHSPSKAFAEVAKFAGLGFILEFRKFATKAYQTGELLGNSAMDGAKTGFESLRDLIVHDIDTDFVMKPVLDLSDVRSSAKEITSMFNSEILRMKTMATNINASMSTNSKDERLYSEMEKLRLGLENAKGDSYTINGLTYEENEQVSDAIKTLIRYTKIKGRT